MNEILEQESVPNFGGNSLDYALVVMHNQLARNQTHWSVRETKLFYSALSQIKWRNDDNWVRLKKADIIDKLEIDKHDKAKLRDMYQDVMRKSMIKFDGATDEEWHDGFLITNIKTTRTEVLVRFSDVFLPLLDQLTSHFTSFALDNVAHLKSKYAIVLYQYLKSWHNPNFIINHEQISLKQLKKIFDIKKDDYVRKTGPNKGIFDTSNFKKYTLDKAVEEINQDVIRSGMHIDNLEVLKHGGFVVGYDIAYSLIGKDGCRLDTPEAVPGQTTIYDF